MRALIDALEIAARSHGVANAAPSPEALLLGTWYARWTALAITAPSDLEPTPPSTLPGGPRMAAIARVA